MHDSRTTLSVPHAADPHAPTGVDALHTLRSAMTSAGGFDDLLADGTTGCAVRDCGRAIVAEVFVNGRVSLRCEGGHAFAEIVAAVVAELAVTDALLDQRAEGDGT